MQIKVNAKVYAKLVDKLKKQQGIVIEPINKETESYSVYLKANIGAGIEACSDKLKVRIPEEGKGYKDISGLLDAVSCIVNHSKEFATQMSFLKNIEGEE